MAQLLDMAEWICDKVCSRHGLSGLSGGLLHSCFSALSAVVLVDCESLDYAQGVLSNLNYTI